jgi:hypothetical protein
VAPVG